MTDEEIFDNLCQEIATKLMIPKNTVKEIVAGTKIGVHDSIIQKNAGLPWSICLKVRKMYDEFTAGDDKNNLVKV